MILEMAQYPSQCLLSWRRG